MTVGDNGKTIDFSMTADAAVTGEGNASVGILNVGDITLLGGDNKTGEFDVDFKIEAGVIGTGDASVGDMKLGNISMTVGDDNSARSRL